MIQELLLGLAGHPTPLFDPTIRESFPLITPAESSLLKSAARLANLHSALKGHLASLTAQHPSLVCRAAATSISSVHLARYRAAIVQVERDVLLKDSSTVGAYDIVPLAGVLGRFTPWRRRLEWYWEVACFMYPADAEPLASAVRRGAPRACTGVDLINKLRGEAKTGFEDIESSALELTRVLERVWVRQLAQWTINGELAKVDTHDFFVRVEDDDGRSDYRIVESLLPDFISYDSANSILFLGKTMRLLKSAPGVPISYPPSHGSKDKAITTSSIQHLQSLLALPSPYSAPAVSAVIAEIRSSMAHEVVDKMLPIHTFMTVLSRTRQIFLGGRVDFLDALIAEADTLLSSRNRQPHSGKTLNPDLSNVMIKEGEVRAVLGRTWTALAPYIGKASVTDECLDWAREHTALTLERALPIRVPRASRGRSQAPRLAHGFFDFLLPVPVALRLRLDPSFDVFIDGEQVEIYTTLHAHLTAVRRAHLHLAELWRLSAARRERPRPARRQPSQGHQRARSTTSAVAALAQIRQRNAKTTGRLRAMRPCWAAASTTASMLAELGSFVVDEVVAQSWAAFESWSDAATREGGRDIELPRDPEVLAAGHRQYLTALVEMVLLTDGAYTAAVRETLVSVERLAGAIANLQGAWRAADLRDEGVVDDEVAGGGIMRDHAREEQAALGGLDDAALALRRASSALVAALQHASARLRTRARTFATTTQNIATDFRPYQDVAGLDRLLLRLGGVDIIAKDADDVAGMTLDDYEQ